jgi:hypothetical protein
MDATRKQLKDNKKLMIFMGAIYSKHSKLWGIGRAELRPYHGKMCVWAEKFYNLSELKYHSDWNWLMNVQERILELYPNCTYHVSVDMKSTMTNDRDYKIILRSYLLFNVEVSGKNHFDVLYKACVEFVDWHNKNIINKIILKENQKL